VNRLRRGKVWLVSLKARGARIRGARLEGRRTCGYGIHSVRVCGVKGSEGAVEFSKIMRENATSGYS
jgi:hypothetical protein